MEGRQTLATKPFKKKRYGCRSRAHTKKEYFLCNQSLVEGLRSATSTSVDGKLHLRDLLVDILHELNDEIDKLALVKSLGMCIGDKEADIVLDLLAVIKSLHVGLTTENKEVISTLSKETHETLGKNGIKLIKLLQANADTDTVDRSLDKNTFLFVTCNDERIAQKFFAHLALDFRLVVTFHNLTGEVCDAHSGSDGVADCVCVWLQCSGLLLYQKK